MIERGPYHSLTSGMTPSERQAWFHEEGEKGRIVKPNAVNYRFRCSQYQQPGGQRRPKRKRIREWYNQAHYGGNEWAV